MFLYSAVSSPFFLLGCMFHSRHPEIIRTNIVCSTVCMREGNDTVNCLNAMGHKSGALIHRDGPLVACHLPCLFNQ